MKGLDRFDSWEQVLHLVEDSGSPLSSDPPTPDFPVSDVPPLERMAQANLGLQMFVGQVVRLMLVGVVIGSFYVSFGLLTVRESTIILWVSPDDLSPIARFGLFGNDLVLTWELLAVSSFIATLSALQFAVSTITDKAYQEYFHDDVTNEAREVLATRALYLAEISQPTGQGGS